MLMSDGVTRTQMFEYVAGGTPMSYTLSQSKYVQPCDPGRCVASCCGTLFAPAGGNAGFEFCGWLKYDCRPVCGLVVAGKPTDLATAREAA